MSAGAWEREKELEIRFFQKSDFFNTIKSGELLSQFGRKFNPPSCKHQTATEILVVITVIVQKIDS